MAWVPLESNPEVMTKFLHKIGVPSKWIVTDVLGLDPELLAMVPAPVLSVILLYPLSADIGRDKDITEEDKKKVSEKVYYLNQYASNACGTIALLHSVANNTDVIELKDGFLKKFLEESKNYSYSQRGQHLIKLQELMDTHMESAQEGQSEIPPRDTPINHHFVAFVHVDGKLYELDGRKSGPIVHGPTTPFSLLYDAAKICKEYIARDPEEMRFTVVALTGREQE